MEAHDVHTLYDSNVHERFGRKWGKIATEEEKESERVREQETEGARV